MWKGNHWVFEATAKTVGTSMPSEVHQWGSLFPTKAMEKFKCSPWGEQGAGGTRACYLYFGIFVAFVVCFSFHY